MLQPKEFGIIGGTKYRNAPAMLPTSQGVTQEVSAPMCSKFIPNSTNESIVFPSIPVDIYQAWESQPSESFSVFPPVEIRSDWGDKAWNDKKQALAPAVLVQEGESFYWDVVRCPYCSFWHRHSADEETLIPTIESNCKRLGPRESHCFEERRVIEAIGWSYWLIGIDQAPSPKEMDQYFPMFPPSPRTNVDQGQGGVYLIKAGDRYKIGKSKNPTKRIQSLRTASPYPVEVIHIEYTPGYSRLESMMHSQFSRWRTHGEWFFFHPDHLARVVATMVGVNYGYY